MKTWCIRDTISGQIFKILLTEEDFKLYLEENPELDECIGCIECDDAPSICIE